MVTRRGMLSGTMASAATLASFPQALARVERGPPDRVALVIGNDRYRSNPLQSAVNDARAMAGLLRQAGFAVELRLNATLAQMSEAVSALGESARRPAVGTALFYYAGHAAQLDWHNYLLPVDGQVASANDVPRECLDVGVLLKELERAKGKTKLVFLDACRDDPFGARFRPPQKGMSPYDAPAGTLLAYATAPGRVALEIPGSANGLYTEHLLRELAAKGVRLEDALKRVRLNVRLASRGLQVPWESTSLENDVFLFPTATPSAAALERQLHDEIESWRRIKASSDPADWVGYLRRYPNGRFAELAQARLRRLLDEREAPAAATAHALRLGPGLPVPAALKASGNPHSAGTYPFRPVWTAGDEYVFNDLDLFSNVVRASVRLVVRRVDAAANRVEFSDGTVSDLMGCPLQDYRRRRYDPPLQLNPTELQVGRAWTSRFDRSGANPGSGEYWFRIAQREKLRVPAGEFHAFRIEGPGAFAGRTQRLTRWVVPGINLSVRRELRQEAKAQVLVSARQAVMAL